MEEFEGFVWVHTTGGARETISGEARVLAEGHEIWPMRGFSNWTRIGSDGVPPNLQLNTFRLGELFEFESGVCVSESLRDALVPHVHAKFERVNIVRPFCVPYCLDDPRDYDVGLSDTDRRRGPAHNFEWTNRWIDRLAAKYPASAPRASYYTLIAASLSDVGVDTAQAERYDVGETLLLWRPALLEHGIQQCNGYLMLPRVHRILDPHLDPSFFQSIFVPFHKSVI